jgi:hypothetical protein
MNDRRPPEQAAADLDAGLCAHCVHVKIIVSARGTRFYLCRKSEHDPSFPRYPRIPVLECRGYERATA